MPRNAQGFLKHDALVQGIAEQYAVMQDTALHQVSLFWSSRRGCYVVRHSVQDATSAIDEATEWEYARDLLRRARATFRQEVRALGGRA